MFQKKAQVKPSVFPLGIQMGKKVFMFGVQKFKTKNLLLAEN